MASAMIAGGRSELLVQNLADLLDKYPIRWSLAAIAAATVAPELVDLHVDELSDVLDRIDEALRAVARDFPRRVRKSSIVAK